MRTDRQVMVAGALALIIPAWLALAGEEVSAVGTAVTVSPFGFGLWYRLRHPAARRLAAMRATGAVLFATLVALFLAYWLRGSVRGVDIAQGTGFLLAGAVGVVVATAGDEAGRWMWRRRASRRAAADRARADAPDLLAVRYRLERRLGRGGMGTVYAARDVVLDRAVAVKMLTEDLADDPAAIERFQREARAAAAFSHPHVVTVFDYGISGTRPFLVMELLEGRTLRDLLRAEDHLAPTRALRLLSAIADAVEAAHARQLIHRDLKPENIFLVSQASGEQPKVLDFGLATLMAGGEPGRMRSAAPAVGGTPLYMAPEQIRGEEPRPSWDVWALAVIAYEMLTGEHPFASLRFAHSPADDDRQSEEAQLGSPLREILARALAIDPDVRPRSSHALVDALQRAADV